MDESAGGPGDDLRWNEADAHCARCGRFVPAEHGYRVYYDGQEQVLCAPCYQWRMERESGGPTGDLTAEVDGGSG